MNHEYSIRTRALNPRVVLLLALTLLATTGIAASGLLPVHGASPNFTLANKLTFCAAPCTGTPTVTTNLGVPNGAYSGNSSFPFFNMTVTATVATSVNFTYTVSAPGPWVTFKTNPVVFSSPGSFDESVTVSAPASGYHGTYTLTITGTDAGGTQSLTYNIKIYTIALIVDSNNTGPTDVAFT